MAIGFIVILGFRGQFDLLSLTRIEVILNTYCKLRKIHCLCHICSRKSEVKFSKIAGAGMFKTRYGLIALIVVDL